MIKDIKPGNESSNLTFLGAVNGNLLFSTFNTSSLNTQLWKTDGSEAGTVVIEGFGNNSFPPTDVINVNGTVYFLQVSGFFSKSLYRSDGTESGTFSVDSVNLRTGANITDLTSVGDSVFYSAIINEQLYFSADDGVNGRELWGLTETNINKDLILGESSNDVLLGNEQDNIIDALKGDDTLTGGNGKDKFVLSTEFGNDVITDFTLGEDEIINATDKIVLTV